MSVNDMSTFDDLSCVALPVGTLLETYELREVLGQGGGGISYRAFDRELEREVVLKEHFPLGLCRREAGTAEVLVVESALYELSLAAFCRGARILAGLQHESVVKVHEIFCACGTAFLVMDYVEGTTLREWMAGKPANREIYRLLDCLLSALGYLHAAGVVHRDIKPANILVREDGLPVLIDFDAAMVGDPTHTPTLVGTPGYAAPEQFVPGAIPGPQADIYALGCSLSRVAADIGLRMPRRIARTLRRACAEKPEQRYAAAADWQRALESTRGRWWFAGGAALLGAAVCVSWYLFAAESQTTPSPVEKVSAEGALSPVQSAPTSAEDVATAEQPTSTAEPTPPKYHPLQLVHFDGQGDFYRKSDEELPPREEALVSAVLTAQRDFEAERDKLSEQYDAKVIKSRKYYRGLAAAKDKANEKVAQLVREFVAVNYAGNDPAGEWTDVFIYQIMSMNPYKSMASVETTHPIHLVKYDEQGYLKPGYVRHTANEQNFATELRRCQEEYHEALNRAEKEAEMAQSPLSSDQREQLVQQQQRILNEKVLKLVDAYLELYIDEEHPEYHLNAVLREKVLKHNIRP